MVNNMQGDVLSVRRMRPTPEGLESLQFEIRVTEEYVTRLLRYSTAPKILRIDKPVYFDAPMWFTINEDEQIIWYGTL